MIRATIILLLLGAAATFGVYYLGGISSFDPTEQGRQARAAINPGMTWNAIVTAAGSPQRYKILDLRTRTINGEQYEEITPGPQVRFDQTLFAQDFANKTMPHGFVFNYMFSAQVAFEVTFDATGVAISIDNVMTMADLLDSRP